MFQVPAPSGVSRDERPMAKKSAKKMEKLHTQTAKELCALIKMTAKKIFGAETEFFQKNIYVYVSNREADVLDLHATSNKRGYHVHCPLPPGIVMTFKTCRKFTFALECFRAGFVDGIGRPVNIIFDTQIYPEKPYSMHHLRSPDQVKYNGTCKLELVEKADTYSTPIAWHEKYTHGPQFAEQERLLYGVVIKNIKNIKDLRCASFFQTHEREVVDKALHNLSTSSCVKIRSFMDKHIVLDRPTEDWDPMMDMINHMWRNQSTSLEKDAHGKTKTLTHVSPCQKLVKDMRENVKVSAGATSEKKFSHHHLKAVERSCFVCRHGKILMTVLPSEEHAGKRRKSTTSSRHWYNHNDVHIQETCLMPFCIRTPHTENNRSTSVHLRIGGDMIRLLLYTSACFKCTKGPCSQFFPNVTIPIQPVYVSAYIEKMIKDLAFAGLSRCNVYMYHRKKDDEMTEEEKADAACMEEAQGSSGSSYNTIVGEKVDNRNGAWYKEHVENLQTLLFLSQKNAIFVGQTASGYMFVASYNDDTVHAHAGGPKAALQLFQHEENVSKILSREEWGLISETKVVSNSNY